MELGTNVQATITGDILTLTIDLSKRHGKSASGKSVIIATTGGNQTLADGSVVGLNVYRKA